MKKILIFYASYGGGHLSAAKSLQTYLEEHYSDVNVQLVDCMKFINKRVEKLTTSAYREMAKKVPSLWGMVYHDSQKGVMSGISKESNHLMAKKLGDLINALEPDLVVSTHPFSSQMTSYLKKKGKVSCKLATVLTDFAIHKQWLVGHEETDFFFVSNETMKQNMIKQYEIEESKIHITGIPMSLRFLEHFNREEVCKQFELDPLKKVYLLFGGGEFGLGKEKTVEVFRSLIGHVPNDQIVAISGKNEVMKEAFETIACELQVESRVKVLGFTKQVPELMSIAELVVTKPGGLTTTESLASGLPLIMINPIPGQEEENAQFLEEKGAGIWIHKKDNPDIILEELFAHEDKIQQMKENVKLLAKKHATEEICQTLLT